MAMKPRAVYIALADEAAQNSKDTGARVGAIIVSTTGDVIASAHNELPDGVADSPERRAVPEKFVFTEHAERNAIFQAARHGHRLEGTTMFGTWYPCAECARAIVQSGICKLFARAPNFSHVRWGKSFQDARQILYEASVIVEYY